MKIPSEIKKFNDIFSQLPGIGPRQAIRLAFYLVYKGGGVTTEAAAAIKDLGEIKICKQCFFVSTHDDLLCDICRDKTRNHKIIAVVEKDTDLISLENTGKFNGRYLILGDLRRKGVLESDQKLKLQALEDFIKNLPGGKAEEIIVAVNPTSVGNLNATSIAEELKPFTQKITRLAVGIPSGGEIEFADADTLTSALERRG